MSQQYDEQGEQQEQEERESLKDLRAAADDGRKAKRELAFVKAGIDTDTPLGAMFATAYAGDLNKDAISEEWAKIAPQPPSVEQEAQQQQREQEQQVTEEQQQQSQDRARRSISSTPAEPVSEPVIDPLVKGYKEFHQNLGDGLSREKAAKPVFEAIIGAAVNGDERFIWDGKWTDDELEQGRVSRA